MGRFADPLELLRPRAHRVAHGVFSIGRTGARSSAAASSTPPKGGKKGEMRAPIGRFADSRRRAHELWDLPADRLALALPDCLGHPPGPGRSPRRGRPRPRASAGAHVPLEVRRIRGRIWVEVRYPVEPRPLVLLGHEEIGTGALRRMQLGHGGDARRDLLPQVGADAAQEPRLPTRHRPDADTLGDVLPAQNGRSGRDCLRPLQTKVRVERGQLDEIARKTEALLSPPGLPQVAAQKRIRRGPVEADAQSLADFRSRVDDFLR
mmetsp:Transcript_9800/g.28462  ORF Transcript_9800/g.28462 Transcript_9800/m.28462 type:complete len:264 (-) Transcript_9800:1304-2095(-)